MATSSGYTFYELYNNLKKNKNNNTYSVEENDFYSFSNEKVKEFVIYQFGGIIAEKIFEMKKTSAGVSNDFEEIRKIATILVTKFGIKGESLIGRKENNKGVKKAISEILGDIYQKADEIIDNKKEFLKILIDEKSLCKDGIKKICEEKNFFFKG